MYKNIFIYGCLAVAYCIITSSLMANNQVIKSKETKTILLGEVEPNTIYKLSFNGDVNSDSVVEKNKEIEDFLFSVAGAKNFNLPCWEIIFKDEDGNIPLGGLKQDFYQKLIHDGNHNYTQEFYAPHFAKTAEIRFKNLSDSSIDVANCGLSQVTNNPTLNVNPYFKNGKYNFSGYGRATQARIKTGDDKRTYLEIAPTRYGMVVTDPVPVVAGKAYRVSLKRYGESEKNVGLNFRFLDDKFRLVCDESFFWKQSFTFYSTWKETQNSWKTFVVPEGAMYVECLLRGDEIARISEFTIIEDKK